MILRQKLSVRLTAVGALVLSPLWVALEQSPQSLVAGGIVTVFAVASLRALLVVESGVVRQRGLLGWSRPVPLDRLTRISLRRGWKYHGVPLVLRLTGPDGAEVAIECWAWDAWSELAHRAGHVARRLGTARDDTSDRRLGCGWESCPSDLVAETAVGDRRADPPPDDDLADLTLVKALGFIATAFAVGSGITLLRAWFRGEVDELLPVAAGGGGLFAVVAAVMIVCAKADDGGPRPGLDEPPPRAWGPPRR